MASDESTGAVSRGVRAVFESGPVAGLTDAQLLERFINRRDDGAGFRALLARHGPMVLGVCRDVLRDEHAADDAFQATFLVLVRKARSVRVEDSLGRWLYGVAWKVAVRARADAFRRARTSSARGDNLESIPEPETPDADRADQKAALHEELARLPETTRAAIVLCHLEGMTHEEAAQRLGWPVGTVRSRLARGRDRLRVRLTRRGLAPAVGVAVLAGESPAAVTPHLTALTVQSALAFSQGQTSMIAGSVLHLTQGVLMSMLFAKLKMAGAFVLASGLIAIGGAGVHAALQAAADHDDGPKVQTATPRNQSTKDQAPSGEGQEQPDAIAKAVRSAPPQELGVRLKLARDRLAIALEMRKNALISALEVADARGQVEIIEEQIVGLRDQLEEELELLKVRQELKAAGVKAAEARLKSARIDAENARKLHKQNVVSNEEATKTEAEAEERGAELEAALAELKEIHIRIHYHQQRLKRLDPLLRTEAADPAAKSK